MNSIWKVQEPISEDIRKEFPEFDPLILQLLHNRHILQQRDMEKFLTPDYETDTHDPFLFRDMRKAVDRILDAIEKKEKVVIYGDYDADGVCASSVLLSGFRRLGLEAHVHLPHREKEGYGLHPAAVKEFIKQGFSLMITCDCGITSVKEIETLSKARVDVIVTDHHVLQETAPAAYAIINPVVPQETYPDTFLVGTGVAFKLMQGLFTSVREKPDRLQLTTPLISGEEKWLLDLVAIATIADFGDLIGENRVFVKFGLTVLQKTRRLGLSVLTSAGKTPITTPEQIAFQLVPRLNAASRMGHANTAFSLLMADDPEKAQALSLELSELNVQRQRVSEQMFVTSKEQIGENPSDALVVAIGDGWQAGVVGLVAGKLLSLYGRPALVIGIQGNEIVGSGRSTQQFDITAALARNKQFLEKFGGHPQACGFTVKKEHLDTFVAHMRQEAQQASLEKQEDVLTIDLETDLESVTWDFWDDLSLFSPFGEGNPRPVFCSRGVLVQESKTVGATGKHLVVHASHKTDVVRKAIAFGFAEDWAEKLTKGARVDIAYEVSLNEWNGTRELQLKIVDIKQPK